MRKDWEGPRRERTEKRATGNDCGKWFVKGRKLKEGAGRWRRKEVDHLR